MVNEHAYAPTLTETARANIETAADLFTASTGLSRTYLSTVLRGDSAFLKRLADTSMNIRSYDEVMGRMSAIWPDDVAWPVSVPRPAPVSLPDEIRAELEAKLADRAGRIARRVAELRAAREAADAELAKIGGLCAPAVAAPAPVQS